MSTNAPHTERWFRSKPISPGFAASQIDAEAGIIYDVVMVEEGEAKGHGVHLDQSFVEDLVAYDQRTFGERGVKGRFGHPNASNSTMGTQMGFFRNIRKRKSDGKMQAIGNLHLLESADISPDKKEMRQWVLSMAQEAPDFLMSSIVFKPGGYYQKKTNGHKVPVASEYDADPSLGNVYVEFGEDGAHYFTDLVEDGAATSSLFSSRMNPHLFVSQAETFLTDNPELQAFLTSNPDKVLAFLNTVGISIPAQTNFKMNILEYLFGKKEDQEPSPEMAEMRLQFEEARTAVLALKSERDDLVSALKKANEDIQALGAQISKMGQDAEALQARIAELEKQPVMQHTAGDAGTNNSSQTKSYFRNPVYLRAKRQA